MKAIVKISLLFSLLLGKANISGQMVMGENLMNGMIKEYNIYKKRGEFETLEEYNERMNKVSNLIDAYMIGNILPWWKEYHIYPKNYEQKGFKIIGMEHIHHLYNIEYEIQVSELYSDFSNVMYIDDEFYDIDDKDYSIRLYINTRDVYDKLFFAEYIAMGIDRDTAIEIRNAKNRILEYSMEDMVLATIRRKYVEEYKPVFLHKIIKIEVNGKKYTFKLNETYEKIDYNFIKYIVPTYKESSILELPIIVRMKI